VRISWLAQTSTLPAAPIPFSWRSVECTSRSRTPGGESSCCGSRRRHEFSHPEMTQASIGLGFLSGALPASPRTRRLALPGCGSSQDLQVHHRQPRSLLGGDVEENLITLCSPCHRQAHLRADTDSRLKRGKRPEKRCLQSKRCRLTVRALRPGASSGSTCE
jgi:hypothetical protein